MDDDIDPETVVGRLAFQDGSTAEINLDGIWSSDDAQMAEVFNDRMKHAELPFSREQGVAVAALYEFARIFDAQADQLFKMPDPPEGAIL